MTTQRTTIAGIAIPDRTLAREATEFVRDASTQLLFDHSRRVSLVSFENSPFCRQFRLRSGVPDGWGKPASRKLTGPAGQHVDVRLTA
jgi:hypothetical protein